MPADRDDWAEAGELLAVTAARLADALPALARIVADVERDWTDGQGRWWAERATLVRGALVHELDAVLDAARTVRTAVQEGGAGDGAAVAGPAMAGGRTGGPRLGGTGGQRADDDRGVRIARWDED